ncbi:SpvB/TcaC N-terminal domain-containing protein [Geotalea sp. SG265]|uniref:SpvB/TcaC N-terminal domain-containing protein n=1 Tax=Geotalea sp. SG265 TaxID=2922867 RepID=UPI001FAECCEE|nr:SpvB/TcaC N-terminal domain-containing protein [Geotalea sp. SG265]
MFVERKFKAITAAAVLMAMLVQPFSGWAATGQMEGSVQESVPVKLTPVKVFADTSALPPKLADDENRAVWRLFDRDTGSTYKPTQTARVTVSLADARSILKLRFFGSSSYQLNIYRDNNGSWESVPSLSNISLASGNASAWNTLNADLPFAAANLLLEFIPQGNISAGIAEVEIWGTGSTLAGDSSPLTLANIRTPEQLNSLLDKAPHIISYAATPSEITVPETAADAAAVVNLNIFQNPSLFKRAYLLYEGSNIAEAVSVERSINNLSWSGGFAVRMPEGATPAWKQLMEEINPAWLLQGENTIRFRSPNGQAYIRNLKLVVETDSGWNSVALVSALELYDGDTATAYQIHASAENPSIQLDFERNVEPEKIRLHLPDSCNLKGEIQYLSGGSWLPLKSGWQLDLSVMQAGWNEVSLPAQVTTSALRIVFNTSYLRLKSGVPTGAIDEVQVAAAPVGSQDAPRLVVSYPRSGQFFGRTAYLQGFATPGMARDNFVQVNVENKLSQNRDGAFSVALSKDDTSFTSQTDDEAWSASVKSEYAGVAGASQTVALTSNVNASTAEAKTDKRGDGSFADNREKHSEKVIPGQAKKIKYKDVTLDIPEGAVDQETEITIVPLNEADLARLDPGMVNVTYPAAGYRFLPHGMKFKKPIKISFGYSRSLFAAGQTDTDVTMFYYNEKMLRWEALTRSSVDPANSVIVSDSDHFTDIINSTLVVPEHPQALSFNPNSIKDIKAADPTANINLIEPPKANNRGTANLSYPIEVPPGRNKIQPNIAVQYNSAGGNGWMGIGWDIPVQAISIDTRWGVPRYDATNETETYTLDGEQLTPLAHRGALQPRTAEKVFHTRVEGQFRKIIRHGTAPSNYWWEVTDKNGTRYFYGRVPNGGNDAVLADADKGNIFKWALRQVRDANGNTVNYSYKVVSNTGIVGGTVPGYQIYLEKIDYTGHNDEPGAYSVHFTRDRDQNTFNPGKQRPDVTIDARSGFKMVTADRLERVEVHFTDAKGRDSLIRSYNFEYVEGAFRKTLLKSVSQYGSTGTFFNKHEFSYYDSVRQFDGSYNGFNTSANWDTVSDNVGKSFLGLQFDASALGGTEGSNIGGSLYVGFGIEPPKHISVGGKLGMSSSDTNGLIAMVDINGDGLADKVFKCGNNVCYRLNTSGPHADLARITFGESHQIEGISDFSRDHSDQISFGIQGFAAGASALFDMSSTTTTQSVYFSDVNGDGLVDLVDEGTVYFNTGKPNGKGNIVFSANSNLTPSPIGLSSVNATGMLPDYKDRYEKMIDQGPLLDGVRRWVVPYDGTISITGGVHLVDSSLEQKNKNYKTADGVRVAVQKEGSELWSDTIKGNDFSVHTPTGLDSIKVKKGERIYFRVQSVFDGSYDQVSWNPTISYVGAPLAQTDANSLPSYQYTAADDMVYGGREFPITLPFKGKVRISGDLSKKGITTDDVTLAVYLNNVRIRNTTLAWDQPGTMTVDDIAVAQGDVLKLKVLVDSDVDLKQIEWKPRVFYVQATYPDTTPLDANGNPAKDSDGNQVGPAPGSPVTIQDDSGNYIVQLKPLYDVDFYPANTLSSPQQSWIASQTGSVLVTPYLTSSTAGPDPSFSVNSSVTFTVKRRNARLGKNVITIAAGVPYNAEQHAVQIPVTAGDELFFDFSTRDQYLAGQIGGVSATMQYIVPWDNINAAIAVPAALHSHNVPDVFSRPYRGWGYIAYNGNRSRASEPIHQELLVVSSNRNDYNLPLPTSSSPITVTPKDFYIALPEAFQSRWTSADQNWWIAPEVTSSSRLGLQYLSVPTADKFNGAAAPSRITESSQTSAGAGYYVAISGTKAPSQTILDYMDMNGDSFPDVVGQGRVQYTTMLGPLEPNSTGNLRFGAVRDTETDSLSIGPGGTVPDTQDESQKKPPAKPESQNPSYGLNGSLGGGWSNTKCDMMDINGDGLPDIVCQNDDLTIRVRLNMGYRYSDTFENWGKYAANMNDGSNISGSVSFSYSDGVKGFAGGPSVSTSKSKNTAQLIDINGDGLLDRVYNDGSHVYVGFNTGADFAPPVLWSESIGHNINSGLNASFGAGLSYYFSIGPFCVAACFIIINPEINGGMSMSREESTLRDVKGDGTADYLYSSTDGKLQVGTNRTQNTNLLKTVKRPLGGSINLEYQREGNTIYMPQSQWTLKKSTLTDGKGNSYATAFSYADGYKDRFEREFYGFQTVTETQAPGTAIERSITETFHTTEFNDERDFYLKGLLLKSVTADWRGNVWAKTANAYNLYPVTEGTDTVAFAQFPALSRTDTYFYDGTTSETGARKSTFQTFAYDSYGDVTTFYDAGELATTADDVTATITYWNDPQQYIRKPDTITVIDAGRNILRKRWASYENGTGNLKSHTSLVRGNQNATWKMDSYDIYGNLLSITDPVGYTLKYNYDAEVNTYVTQIADNFSARDGGPYWSQSGYDPKWGKPAWMRDVSGAYQLDGYDEFGRLQMVYGPYDTDSSGNAGTKPTLFFEYKAPVIAFDGENLTTPAGAITRNKAVSRVGSNGNTLDTIIYADGMKRVLQTKKEADVEGRYGMVVSGLITYDELGRTIEQAWPNFQSTGDLYGYVPIDIDKKSTKTAYDPLDRTIRLETPDRQASSGYAITTTSYGFGQVNNSGTLYATTKVVDPIGNAAWEANRKGTKLSYKDVDDRIMAVVEFNHGAPITTTYDYDPLGQITLVKDDRGNRTTVEYDLVGKRTAIVNPDTGRTEYDYDANGNLTSKLTANYQKGKEIRYDYIFNRLMRINYPDTTDVTYEYGPMGAFEYRAGRVTRVTDESGTEERYYGALGETIREVKQVNAKTPAAQRKIYTTDYVFDSFGRMLQMTYPDGENLYYSYDNGGLLNAAWGEKRGNRYNYINALTYDKFGQRKFIAYGNGVKSSYSYDDKTRRLDSLVTTTPDTRTVQNMSYEYDLVGNVLKVHNNINVPTNTALPAGPVIQQFTYDDLYQLTVANGEYQFGPGKGNRYTNEFSYDTIGNFTRKSQLHKIIQPSASEHLPKETNYLLNYKYTSSHPHAVTDAGDKLYAYDNNGNMTGWDDKTSGKRRTILWNEENRVKEIQDNGKSTYFLYDDQGERVLKRGQHGETFYINRFYSIRNGELGTKSIYAGNTRVVSKLVKTPNTVTDNTTTTTNSTTPGINGLDNGQGKKLGIIRRLNGTNTTTAILPPEEKDQFFYHGDHLGSSNMITDAKGAIYQHLEYFPYGETWIEEGGSYGGNTPGYKFTGKELDPETGLYYFGARYYEPVISRWISADPILGKYLDGKPNGGIYRSLNVAMYTYGYQSPLVLVDPDGNAPTAKEAAVMSSHVYGGSGTPLIGGWQVAPASISRQAGIRLRDDSTGFNSQLYVRGKNEYFYATQGTEPKSVRDWENNVGQVFGKSAQYRQSATNARTLNRYLGAGADLSFGGHSLGGGLAAANSMATGRDAQTFNAAAVSKATKNALGLGQAGQIDAYVVRGEILDKAQGLIGMTADGTRHTLEPSIPYAPNIPFTGVDDLIRGAQSGYNHTMGVVLDALP